jgi:hypothetical protein
MSEDRNRNSTIGAPGFNRTADAAATNHALEAAATNRPLEPATANPSPEPATASTPSPDVSLLLRAHSEQHLLSREVIPVVRQLETGERLPEEQLPAAAAYLEVIWTEAATRARETDAALRELEQLDLARQPLPTRARRYHAAVRALREAVARRVAPLIAVASSPRPLPEADERGNLHGLIL